MFLGDHDAGKRVGGDEADEDGESGVLHLEDT
jgi:hypothetical protein